MFLLNLSEDINLKETLKLWTYYFRNLLLGKIKNNTQDNSLIKIKKILNSIQEANYLLANTNVNTRLLLENLMTEI